MMLAATDWALHLACAPGRQLQLGAKAARKYWRLSDYIGRSLSDPGAAPAIEPLRQDRRFTDPAWKEPPFNLIVQRSEEHTSELQSLLRISYAVFCLKTKRIK